MIIDTVKRIDDNNVKVNGKFSVPLHDMGNRHTVLVQAWLDAGGVISPSQTSARQAEIDAQDLADQERKAAIKDLDLDDLKALIKLAKNP